MRLAAAALAASMILAGCASTPERWYLNGRSEAQFQADHARCSSYAASQFNQDNADTAGQLAANKRGGLAALMAGMELGMQEVHFGSCMNQLGYLTCTPPVVPS